MRCCFAMTCFGAVCFATSALASAPVVEKPAALIADGVPPVPRTLADGTRPYMEFRTASFQGWNPVDRSVLFTTRFANTAQLHQVKAPGAARTQLSFEVDRVALAAWAPSKGDVMVVMKDVGGDEFFQLYTLDQGRLTLLTDGKSRNFFNAWPRTALSSATRPRVATARTTTCTSWIHETRKRIAGLPK